MLSIANKIKQTLTFCNYCCINTHKIINCNCSDFLQFRKQCIDLREVLCINIDEFKKWLLACFVENNKLLYYFALSTCQFSPRTNRNNGIYITEKIATYFYKSNISCLENYMSLDKSTNIKEESLKMQSHLPVLSNRKYECVICFNDNINMHNMIVLNCNHIFCKDCIILCLKSLNIQHNCFLCRDAILKSVTFLQ